MSTIIIEKTLNADFIHDINIKTIILIVCCKRYIFDFTPIPLLSYISNNFSAKLNVTTVLYGCVTMHCTVATVIHHDSLHSRYARCTNTTVD